MSETKFECRFCGGTEFVESNKDGRGWCGSCHAFGYRGGIDKATEKCGLCGSSVQALGPVIGCGTIMCMNQDCQAKWWNRWHTKAEWKEYVNVVDGVDWRKKYREAR